MTLINYLTACYQVIKELHRQQQFNNTFLTAYLQELEEKYQGKFSEEQRFKIEKYYGRLIAPILCGTYKLLYGEKLSEAERKRATLFGILTPMGDDLFDVHDLPIDNIKKLTFEPARYHATLFAENVVQEIQTYLLAEVPNKDAYLHASKDVLDLQVATAAQTSPTISYDVLKDITFRKGAVSVIIYHQILSKAADKEMLAVLEEIGGLYQLGNDLFDVYKDTRDRIFTIPNMCKDFHGLKKDFLTKVRKQNQLIAALPYRNNLKQIFSIIINSINARSLVAIEEWIQFYAKQGTERNLDSFTRKELIIDMEKPRLFIKALYYTWKLPRMK